MELVLAVSSGSKTDPRCLPGVTHQSVLARANNPRLAFVGGLRRNKNNNNK